MGNDSETFGQLLRRYRRAAKLSQEELAKRSGVDYTYVSKLENDRVNPPAEDTIVRFCQILHVDSDELLFAARRVPTDIGSAVVSSKSALQFLRTAETMQLSEGEWLKLTSALKNLRDD
jgi:transcriptional regulator with XRE-family HTH domain